MSCTPDTPIHAWADRLEAELAAASAPIARRVVVLAETASTQDAARRHAIPGEPLLVVTGRQTHGRGRLGRVWRDDGGLGVSMTLATSDTGRPAAEFSLAAGVAIAEVCEAFVGHGRIGLKWPNDVVCNKTGRKLAGVLVESVDGVVLIGMGINANQTAADWAPAEPRDHAVNPAALHAVSVAQLAGPVDRLAVMTEVVRRLSVQLHQPEERLVAQWRRRDVLTGTRAGFEHDGVRYEGIVESIDPTLTLVVRTADGLVRLPALTTSLVRDPS